jgi:hypothetical protein
MFSLRLLTLALGLVGSAALMAQDLPQAPVPDAAQAAAVSTQPPWREYPGIERRGRNRRDPPPQTQPLPAEFVVGRLMYPESERSPFRRGRGGDWRQGGTAWTVDYPEGDRTFARLLTRLTTTDVRVLEQPVNLDDGDTVYDFPFLISGLVGSWNLTDEQAAKLRDYLLKGGFLLCDSFFGQSEWDGFMATLKRVFPDRLVVELPDDHPIFHSPFDLSDKRQIPTWQYLPLGYRDGGSEPYWRGILDDDGRVMVMIAFNNDIADGWQRADDPGYPQFEANMAIRLGVNFAVYAMTH